MWLSASEQPAQHFHDRHRFTNLGLHSSRRSGLLVSLCSSDGSSSDVYHSTLTGDSSGPYLSLACHQGCYTTRHPSVYTNLPLGVAPAEIAQAIPIYPFLPGYAAVPSRFVLMLAEHGMTLLYALSSSPTALSPLSVHVHPTLLETEDSGDSFHGRHDHYWLHDDDEFYHYSRHRFVYTRAGTRLLLGAARDGAGQHSRLPKDRCMCGPVLARDNVCS
ncbi:hypothetical protein E2562_022807 [Oryza meyeriana var. granulata]|uniref:Uncharacterized protein n=1 Tax=Oryza meyeriana var. granulata TaxID=110450 RepID=A0A6G1FAX7_9ORYZ|nr:hypothetical protein E2562_022807 [Oryza meyeriana var. granulata]